MNHDSSKQPSSFLRELLTKPPKPTSQADIDDHEQFEEIGTEGIDPTEDDLLDCEQPEVSTISLSEERYVNLEANLLELKNLFEQRIQYDEDKNKAFDKLYDKMKEAESGFQASLKESMIRSLLLLYDSIVGTEKEFITHNVHRTVISRVALLRDELLNILYSEDVEPIGERGLKFDRHIQQATRTVPTSNADEDYLIEDIVREGFTFRGKILRPQSVIVRRYDASASE